ncbi:MAG: WD40 repeat domain-containing protein [Planctomycetia bacterium]|nr:WD40 repeat domain-containing protein [Planctomycetia bacterium]
MTQRNHAWTCTLLLAAVPAVAAEEPLPAQARAVLKTHCARCHSTDAPAKGGFDYVLRPDLLTARNRVVPGKAAESDLYQRTRDGDMPPKQAKVRPTAEELAILEKWINQGAASWEASSPRNFVTEADTLRAMRQDLEALPALQRRYYRYFTLANLSNAGRPEPDLQEARLGLAKLLNSLSWQPRIALPAAIDGSGLVLRLDLRDLKWNERFWDRLVFEYPYRTGTQSRDALRLTELAGTAQPWLRADWFIATASRAPLYYDLAQIPTTAGILERALNVDAAANINELSVARAGFNGSGVSKNNRMLERHDAGYGAYWKTYDFAENVDKQNLFDRPLGPPPARNSFVHDGGEMIFHLPNGLLGYLLAESGGRRIDRAPVAIVSDPNRPDKVVEAGLSCFSCHAAGMIHKADQVRSHVLKNAAAFAKEDVDTIKTIYPPEAKFKELLDEDNKRYQEALKKLGLKPDARDPINAVTHYYEGVVDLNTAAADAGLKTEEFTQRLAKAPTLNRPLGALRTKGGTVQRQAFTTAFPELVKELRLADETGGTTDVVKGTGHTGTILAIAVSADGQRLLSGSEDRTLRLWDINGEKELKRFEGHRAAVSAVAISPDGKRALSGSHDRTIRLWDLETGKELRVLTGHTDKVAAVAFSPNGKWALSSGHDRTVRYWKLETGEEARLFSGHTDIVSALAFSADGKHVVTGSHDRSVRVWDVATGEMLRQLLGAAGEVFSVAFSPDGKLVAAGGNDKHVRLWGADSGQEISRMEGHANAVIRVAFSADGRSIWSGSSQYQTGDKTVRVWNTATGREVRSYGGEHQGRISVLAFAPDGSLAVSDGIEPVLRTWKLDK